MVEAAQSIRILEVDPHRDGIPANPVSLGESNPHVQVLVGVQTPPAPYRNPLLARKDPAVQRLDGNVRIRLEIAIDESPEEMRVNDIGVNDHDVGSG